MPTCFCPFSSVFKALESIDSSRTLELFAWAVVQDDSIVVNGKGYVEPRLSCAKDTVCQRANLSWKFDVACRLDYFLSSVCETGRNYFCSERQNKTASMCIFQTVELQRLFRTQF